MRILYKRRQRFAIAMDVWPGFDPFYREAYLIDWFMRDVLFPPYFPHFGDPA